MACASAIAKQTYFETNVYGAEFSLSLTPFVQASPLPTSSSHKSKPINVTPDTDALIRSMIAEVSQ